MENKITEVSLVFNTNVKALDRAQESNSREAVEVDNQSWERDGIYDS